MQYFVPDSVSRSATNCSGSRDPLEIPPHHGGAGRPLAAKKLTRFAPLHALHAKVHALLYCLFMFSTTRESGFSLLVCQVDSFNDGIISLPSALNDRGSQEIAIQVHFIPNIYVGN